MNVADVAAASRPILWNIPLGLVVYMYGALVVALAIAGWGVWRRVRVWRLGKPEARTDQWQVRLKRVTLDALLQRGVVRERAPGLAHAALWSGFVVLFGATLVVMAQMDAGLPIMHGRFYMRDEYPDIELFNTAAMLARKFSPDYMLVHPMGMDYLGERYGADSPEYRNNAGVQDNLLAPLILEWLSRGYDLLITGDHGINADHTHGGTTPDVRMVPLFIIQPSRQGAGNTGETISQLQIAPTLCKLLGLPIPSTMKYPPVV